MEELEKAALDRAMEYVAPKARSDEQERSMQGTLERLRAFDTSAHLQQERISELEKVNRDLAIETHPLKSKASYIFMRCRMIY